MVDKPGRDPGPDPAADRAATARWAWDVLAQAGRPDAPIIFNTETTGLGVSEPIELAVLDLQGRVLLDTPVRPVGAIEPEATAVHGVTNADRAEAPPFVQVYFRLLPLLAGRRVLVYGARFHQDALTEACRRAGLPAIPGGERWECVMDRYAAFVGEITPPYRTYRWQKLPDAPHTAADDCQATLALLTTMAAALGPLPHPPSVPPPPVEAAAVAEPAPPPPAGPAWRTVLARWFGWG